jgi:hypothetical protein
LQQTEVPGTVFDDLYNLNDDADADDDDNNSDANGTAADDLIMTPTQTGPAGKFSKITSGSAAAAESDEDEDQPALRLPPVCAEIIPESPVIFRSGSSIEVLGKDYDKLASVAANKENGVGRNTTLLRGMENVEISKKPVNRSAPASRQTKIDAFMKPRTALTPSQFSSAAHLMASASRKSRDPSKSFAANAPKPPVSALSSSSSLAAAAGKPPPIVPKLIPTLSPSNNQPPQIPPRPEEVVRDRAKRQHMHADDCPCCKSFHEVTAAWLENTQDGPPIITNGRSSNAQLALDEANRQARMVQRKKQLSSRHRRIEPRPQTPEGYWNVWLDEEPEYGGPRPLGKRQQ